MNFIFSILFASLCFAQQPQALPPTVGLPPPPELKDLPEGRTGEIIKYGFELLANTAEWIGPNGKIKAYAGNRMACRNCHLDVGQRPGGNSWLDTHGLYPQYRAREGMVQTLAERVNVCIEHPLNGKPLPQDSPEMKAILLYLQWIGRGRPILKEDPDDRLVQITMLPRKTDMLKGKVVFENRCVGCHGADGQGKLKDSEIGYTFPPLWGKNSFVMGSSMSRVSVLARFIKGNMPLGARATSTILTDEEAWDVAGYINSHDRPKWRGLYPFPSKSEKPFDFPIGPYADPFPLEQHLFGPFQPIIDYWKERGKNFGLSSLGI
jgi:thiosulfate dehydrogenase